MIRTCDILLPKQARYQAAPRSDSCCTAIPVPGAGLGTPSAGNHLAHSQQRCKGKLHFLAYFMRSSFKVFSCIRGRKASPPETVGYAAKHLSLCPWGTLQGTANLFAVVLFCKALQQVLGQCPHGVCFHGSAHKQRHSGFILLQGGAALLRPRGY